MAFLYRYVTFGIRFQDVCVVVKGAAAAVFDVGDQNMSMLPDCARPHAVALGINFHVLVAFVLEGCAAI